MGSQFNWYVGDDTTVQQNRQTAQAPAASQSGQTSQFASEFQQVLGEGSEPDPLFFIETWTLGTPAAIENFRLRQSSQAVNNPQTSGNFEPAFASCHHFFSPAQLNWAVFTSVHTIAPESCSPISAYQSQFGQDSTGESNVNNQDEALPLTLDGACRILGVTPSSSLSQIKTAHRQLVNAWHPDRHQNEGEEIRRYATGKMATINAAYCILRNDSLLHSS
jgi:hypothetical protein